MKIRKVGLVCLAFMLLTGCTVQNGETTASERDYGTEIASYMEAYQAYYLHPYQGAVLVAKGGEVLYEEAFGIADDQTDRMNTIDSVFPIGSVTKSFTAAAILQLQEEGLLDVSDPIGKYVAGHPSGDKITIHQLLTHTSGLAREGLFLGISHVDLDTNIDFINRSPVQSEPGAVFAYSNAGYQYLAKIIEVASGKDYNTYIQEEILTRLGMTHSYMGVDESYSENQSIGYEVTGGAPIRMYIYNFSAIIGGGNIYSTLADMLKYIQALEGSDLLSNDSMKSLNQGHVDAGGYEYGYGWEVMERFDTTRYSHGGCIGNGGYNSLVIRYPKEKTSLIFLTNNMDTTALFAVSETIEAILFDQPYLKPIALDRMEMDPAALQEYEGLYQLEGEVEIPFTVKKGKLMSFADDGNEYEVIPIARDRFYYEGHETVQMIFKRENGTIIGVTFFNHANRFEGIKIEK